MNTYFFEFETLPSEGLKEYLQSLHDGATGGNKIVIINKPRTDLWYVKVKSLHEIVFSTEIPLRTLTVSQFKTELELPEWRVTNGS